MSELVSLTADGLPDGVSTVVTVGTFDGLHQGHLQILDEVKRQSCLSSDYKLASLVVTFDPHPRKFLQPDYQMGLLTTAEQKIKLLAQAGIDYIAVLPFNKKLASLSPEDFVEQYLVGRFKMKNLVIGYDHAFGKDRSGSEVVLQKLSSVYGYKLTKVPPVINRDAPISSSLIRKAINAGQMGRACELLGRYYSFTGTVVSGAGRGKDLGHPTANLTPVSEDCQLFSQGIYAALTELDGKLYGAALHHGPRPAFNETEATLELNLYDFSGDLYGKTLEVSVIERIRPVMDFSDVAELKKKMDEDDLRIKEIIKTVNLKSVPLSLAG